VHIDCPQDAIIIKLNADLNDTYLWYGAREARAGYALNQTAQDENAAQAGADVAATRGAIKAGRAYDNRNRDLVDAVKEDRDALKRVPKEELPESLQGLTPAERVAKVDQAAARRAEIQAKITKLAAEREKYLEAERRRLAAESDDPTLGDAVVATIQKQLTKSGFEAEE
jgi:hypothetical protein